MEPADLHENTNYAGGCEKIENHPAASFIDSGDETPVKTRPINVHTIADAKRLLSRVIGEVQKGTIDGKKAKELTYLLSTFVQIAKQSEFDARLAEIEKKLSIELGGSENEG